MAPLLHPDPKGFRLNVRDFTTTPGPRYSRLGDGSGEEFRKVHLVPAFEQAREKGVRLVVDLDGTSAYGSSFLEEAFGGLARAFDAETVLAVLDLRSEARPWYLPEVLEEYIPEANSDYAR